METSEHRVLAEASRAQIVEELTRSSSLDVQQLAGRTDLHPNTVRWHLGVLEDAGLITSAPERRGRRGRPRLVYRVEPGATSSLGEYRLLATALAGLVDGGDAERAGRAWGRHLAPESAAEPIRAVESLLTDHGFTPVVDGRELRMRRCPFYELAVQHPNAVCRLHRGIIDGALEQLGSPLRVAELDVLVQPDLCVAHLAPPSS